MAVDHFASKGYEQGQEIDGIQLKHSQQAVQLQHQQVESIA